MIYLAIWLFLVIFGLAFVRGAGILRERGDIIANARAPSGLEKGGQEDAR
ncbi:MAG: hypothetical protein IPM64_17370 [Phycisphaerales bacterium]|nr:hypothetical protein [Phycisphaerales bacterium]